VGRITRSLFPPSKPLTVSSATVLVRLLNIWRRLREEIFDAYHPEVNYMRGVGPKWREKRARATSVLSASRHGLSRRSTPTCVED
jgi:hypothetical protein